MIKKKKDLKHIFWLSGVNVKNDVDLIVVFQINHFKLFNCP